VLLAHLLELLPHSGVVRSGYSSCEEPFG